MSANPVLDATARYAGACQTRDPEKMAEAKKALAEAKLRRAVNEALAHIPPLTDEVKSSVARMLTTGGEANQ